MIKHKLYISLAMILFVASCCNSSKYQASNEVIQETSTTQEPQESTSGLSERERSVFFAFDDYRLTASAKADLKNRIIPWLQENPRNRIVVEGHADERGTVAYNKKLGMNRANSVKSYLRKNNISAKRVQVISYGESKPLVQGRGEAVWSQNRRTTTNIVE